MNDQKKAALLAAAEAGYEARHLPEQGVFSHAEPHGSASALDLFDPDTDLAEVLTLSEPYTMPNGKQVWVHPCSLEEAKWINLQAAKEVRGLNLTDEDEIRFENLARGQAYQVVACCRRGPRPDDPLMFKVKHLTLLRTNPGYRAAVTDIVRISDRLSGDGFTRSAFDAYFFDLERQLGILSSQLNGDGFARATCAKLERCVSLTRQRRTLLMADLEEAPEETDAGR